MWGYSVVGVASTLKEAFKEAKLAKEKKVQVAIIDGNLGSGAPGTKDGAAVVSALLLCASYVYTIAHTAQEDGSYGHIFVPKGSPLNDLKSAIEKALVMDLNHV